MLSNGLPMIAPTSAPYYLKRVLAVVDSAAFFSLLYINVLKVVHNGSQWKIKTF